jgi:hypothetical protein
LKPWVQYINTLIKKKKKTSPMLGGRLRNNDQIMDVSIIGVAPDEGANWTGQAAVSLSTRNKICEVIENVTSVLCLEMKRYTFQNGTKMFFVFNLHRLILSKVVEKELSEQHYMSLKYVAVIGTLNIFFCLNILKLYFFNFNFFI